MTITTSLKCVICNSNDFLARVKVSGYVIFECTHCKFQIMDPQPSDDVLSNIYNQEYFVLASNFADKKHVSDLKRATADQYLSKLLKDVKNINDKLLLEIGCGTGDFLHQAAIRGLTVTGVEYSSYAAGVAKKALSEMGGKIYCGELTDYIQEFKNVKFDYIVFFDVLEHLRDPREFLKNVYGLLKTGGTVFCIVPSLDSFSAKLFKTKWMEYKVEHLYYFNNRSLNSLFFQEGFSKIEIFSSKKTLSIDYIAAHFKKHYTPLVSKLVSLAYQVLPKKFTRKKLHIHASGIGLIAKKNSSDEETTVSVIIPVYNEAATVGIILDKVISKKIPDLKLELIIVESNSTDGSRRIVESYQNMTDVKVILQDSPMGKGNAVRAGLKVASGSVILIQDADDEYDINDYESLLEPVVSGREFFVLGSRHGCNGWKLRKFTDAPFKAFILNVGHLVFTELLNISNGVRLKDPFTMYKVFRTDCLRGITLECNRFDFDHELVIKLIRAGFIPKEIPVTYKSRSFIEGKKVTMFFDPLTWIKAIIKYSFFSSGKK